MLFIHFSCLKNSRPEAELCLENSVLFLGIGKSHIPDPHVYSTESLEAHCISKAELGLKSFMPQAKLSGWKPELRHHIYSTSRKWQGRKHKCLLPPGAWTNPHIKLPSCVNHNLVIFGVLAMAKLAVWIWIRSLEQAYKNCFLILISSAQFYKLFCKLLLFFLPGQLNSPCE